MSETNDIINPDEELFTSYLDGRLTPSEVEEFERKLVGDPDFEGRFQVYRRTVELLRRVGPARAPETLLPTLQRRLVGRAMREAMGHQLRFPYEVVVFMALLAGIFYMYFVMVPTNPRDIVRRDKPVLVEVELLAPVAAEIRAEFDLQEADTGRPHERGFFGKYGREEAARLLTAIASVAKTPQSLPKVGDHFAVLLTFPRHLEP
jgi:hypothetical protein